MAAKKTTKKAKAKNVTPKRKVTAVQKPMTKSAIINEVVGNTDLTKKQVTSVFEELGIIIERHIFNFIRSHAVPCNMFDITIIPFKFPNLHIEFIQKGIVFVNIFFSHLIREMVNNGYDAEG